MKLLLLLIVLLELIWLGMVTLKLFVLKLNNHVYRQVSKLYFHGHPLDQVLLRDFFYRYGATIDFGLCGAVSALMMLALRDNHTARIVRGYWHDKEKGKLFHSWVEFRFCGIWFATDPCWTDNGSFHLRCRYRLPFTVKVTYTCPYQEFWFYAISEEFYQKLQNPATSYLLYELFDVYTRRDDPPSPFHCQIAQMHLNEAEGKRLSAAFALDSYYDKVIFSQRIVDDFMARPQRQHLKGHSLRQYYAIRKQARREYQEYLAQRS